MKKLIFLFCWLWACSAWGASLIGSGIIASTTTSTDHHFLFTSAGGTNSEQFYDEDTSSWVGSGADTLTFTTDGSRNVIKCTDTTCDGFLPHSLLDGLGEFTFEIVYRSDSNNGSSYLYHLNTGGDSFSFKPYSSSGYAQSSVRANYGTEATATISQPTNSTWHTLRVLVDLDGQDLTVYVDGVEQTHSADTSGLANWNTLGVDLELLDLAATQDMYIDEIKIWESLETP